MFKQVVRVGIENSGTANPRNLRFVGASLVSLSLFCSLRTQKYLDIGARNLYHQEVWCEDEKEGRITSIACKHILNFLE